MKNRLVRTAQYVGVAYGGHYLTITTYGTQHAVTYTNFTDRLLAHRMV